MGKMKDVFTARMLADEATADCLFTYWEGEPVAAGSGFQIPTESQLTAADHAAIDAINWFPVGGTDEAECGPGGLCTSCKGAGTDWTQDATGANCARGGGNGYEPDAEADRDDVQMFIGGGFDAVRSVRRSETTELEMMIELRYGIRDGDAFFFTTLMPLGFADDWQTTKTTTPIMPTLAESFDKAIFEFDALRFLNQTDH